MPSFFRETPSTNTQQLIKLLDKETLTHEEKDTAFLLYSLIKKELDEHSRSRTELNVGAFASATLLLVNGLLIAGTSYAANSENSPMLITMVLASLSAINALSTVCYMSEYIPAELSHLSESENLIAPKQFEEIKQKLNDLGCVLPENDHAEKPKLG